MQYSETHKTLAKCFEEMESLTAIISNRLEGVDVPVEALFVEYWPIFIKNQITYKIWNGIEHLVPIKRTAEVPSLLTAKEILEVVRRREILYRKF